MWKIDYVSQFSGQLIGFTKDGKTVGSGTSSFFDCFVPSCKCIGRQLTL